MPRKVKCNHAVKCKPLGVGPCKASIDGLKKPRGVTAVCPYCKEKRCALHCGCGRQGLTRAQAKAKLEARSGNTARKRATKQALGRQAQTRVVLPVKEKEEPKVLGAGALWDDALPEVAAAKKSVFVASMLYDNSKLQTKLVAALARGVKVVLLVDKVSLETSKKSAERLKTLKEKGGKVYLASGKSYQEVFGVAGRRGNYHCKTLVVDAAVTYLGSLNLTNNSLVNGELAAKIPGVAFAAAVYKQAWDEAKGFESF